jgi:hypothetical protein
MPALRRASGWKTASAFAWESVSMPWMEIPFQTTFARAINNDLPHFVSFFTKVMHTIYESPLPGSKGFCEEFFRH